MYAKLYVIFCNSQLHLANFLEIWGSCLGRAESGERVMLPPHAHENAIATCQGECNAIESDRCLKRLPPLPGDFTSATAKSNSSSLPHTLARLDMKGNNIQRIQEQELKNLGQLQVLNLRNNKITALDHGLVKHLPRLRHLYLEGNPWNCTCDLIRTRRVLTAKGTDVKGGQCSAPAESKGESWMSSKRILHLCIHDNLYSEEEGKEIRKKANADNPSSLRVDTDDYYDYETD